MEQTTSWDTRREFLELTIAITERQIERFMPVGEDLLLLPEAALRHRQVGQQVRSLP